MKVHDAMAAHCLFNTLLKLVSLSGFDCIYTLEPASTDDPSMLEAAKKCLTCADSLQASVTIPYFA